MDVGAQSETSLLTSKQGNPKLRIPTRLPPSPSYFGTKKDTFPYQSHIFSLSLII